MELDSTNRVALFGKKLTEAIRFIKSKNNKNINIIEDELGHAIGRSGATIERWRQGYLPPETMLKEDLARAIYALGGKELGRAWFESFLHQARYRYPEKFCDELFPPTVDAQIVTQNAVVSSAKLEQPIEAEPVTSWWQQRNATIQIWGMGIAFLFLLILMVGLLAGFPEISQRVKTMFVPEPARMADNTAINIAIAGFVEDGEPSTVGTQLAEDFYVLLAQNLGVYETTSLTFDIWGPEQVETAVVGIEGVDNEQRSLAAAKIAQEINANIVVYGVITSTDTDWILTPEFHVELLDTAKFSASESDERLGERVASAIGSIQELSGTHELGQPFEMGKTVMGIESKEKLAPRVDLLSQIVLGLLFYSDQNYDRAAEFFYTGLSLYPAQSEMEDGICVIDSEAETFSPYRFDDNAGKQVLYLLLGNAMSQAGNLDCAELFYEAAQVVHPEQDYARAYAGLGGVYYMRGLGPPLDSEFFDLSIEQFTYALESTHQPPSADIATKVHFGLGHIYLVRGYANKQFDEALAAFERVIADFDEGTNSRVRSIAGESHARLGLIYRELADCDPEMLKMAVQAYQNSAEILRFVNPVRSEFFAGVAQEIEENRDCQSVTAVQ